MGIANTFHVNILSFTPEQIDVEVEARDHGNNAIDTNEAIDLTLISGSINTFDPPPPYFFGGDNKLYISVRDFSSGEFIIKIENLTDVSVIGEYNGVIP